MQNAHLELRHLRLVRAIAQEASVTRAAGLLHLSQSAVSHQLVDLERDLGARLFDRVGKRMVLTAVGTRLVEGAERVLREVSTLERALVASSRDARTVMRITMSCYTSYHWLPAAIEHFAEKHPRVDFTIVMEATKRAIDALLADEVDVAVVYDLPRDESLTSIEIVESELVVVARATHPVVAAKDAVRYYDLARAVVMVHDAASSTTLTSLQEAVRTSHERKTGERLVEPMALRRIPLTEAMIALARAGAGVTVLDRWLVEPYLDRTLVARPLHPRTTRTFHAVFRRQNPRALPIEALARVIKAEALRAMKPRARRRAS